MDSAIFGFLGGIVAAVLVFIGSIFNTFGRSKDSSKEILTRTITNERAQWRKDIRDLTGEFVENALRVSIDDPNGSECTLEKLGVLIRIRLNPWDDFDVGIAANTEAIVLHAKAKRIDNLQNMLLMFEGKVRVLLKGEWDKSKREAETGVLDISTKKQKP